MGMIQIKNKSIEIDSIWEFSFSLRSIILIIQNNGRVKEKSASGYRGNVFV